MMGFGLIVPLLLIGVIAYAWLATAVYPNEADSKQPNSARDPNARYARGEIGREEYEQMRRDLKADLENP